MGNDLASYRSAIGLFNIKLQRLSITSVFITRHIRHIINAVNCYLLRIRSFMNEYVPTLNYMYVICNFYFSFIAVLLTCHNHHHHFNLNKQASFDYKNYHLGGYDSGSVIVSVYYCIIVQILLIISGDVELNPGPNVDPKISTISIVSSKHKEFTK